MMVLDSLFHSDIGQLQAPAFSSSKFEGAESGRGRCLCDFMTSLSESLTMPVCVVSVSTSSFPS